MWNGTAQVGNIYTVVVKHLGYHQQKLLTGPAFQAVMLAWEWDENPTQKKKQAPERGSFAGV